MRQEMHRDDFGIVSHDDSAGLLELRWLEGSANMTDDDFKESMSRYATHAEELKPNNLLVDVTKFAHSPGTDVGPWRDEEIIPRYNAAGVTKFAFIVPHGSPGTVANGNAPAVEPPGRFPTAYFDDRDAALKWFGE
jgi:hypothetical protein